MARWIDNILNGLFYDPAPRSGEGLEVTFVHSWPWPPWITLLFLIAAGVYIFLIYVREPGQVRRRTRLAVATLRLALIVIVITMMYGWMRDRYRTDLPDMIIVVDDSESMKVADQYGSGRLIENLTRRLRSAGLEEATRINVAKSLLLDPQAGWLRNLQGRYNLKFYLLGMTARAKGGDLDELEDTLRALKADQTASRLGDGLQDILEMQRGRPTAAIVMMTDGVTTEGKSIREVSHYAYRKGIPLFILGLGDEQPPRDLRLSDLLVDDAVFLGDLVNFDVKLAGTGFTSETVKIRLKYKGRAEVLAEQEVKLTGDTTPESARLSYRPGAEGEFDFEIEVDPLQNEANVANNRVSQTVRVRNEAVRVLLVQEYPSLEFRFLKTLLERGLRQGGQGKVIELTTVLQEADTGYVDLDESAQRVFPVGRDELYEFDVVIFGDVNPSFMSRPVLENLVAFVKERGGGMVFVAGPRHTPLAYRDTPLEALFPIDLDSARLPEEASLTKSSFRVELTRLGLTSPHMQLADRPAENLDVWRNLPPLRWAMHAPDTRSAVRVLAERHDVLSSSGTALPVVCMQFVGAGRVIFHGTDESYLWSRFRGSDRFYERYWIQLIRYLSRTKLLGTGHNVEIITDRSQYHRGESVPISVRYYDERKAPVADDGVVVVVERDRGRRQRVKLHRNSVRRGFFDGVVSNLPEGSYRTWVIAPTFDEKPPERRFAVVPPPGEQARLAMDSRDLKGAAKPPGGFYTVKNAGELPGDLPRGHQVRIESLPSAPVWNSSLLAGLFVVILVVEWLWRRRIGWL